MNKEMYTILHQAADRLALEDARREKTSDEHASVYIAAYKNVLEYLVSEYKKNFPSENTHTLG